MEVINKRLYTSGQILGLIHHFLFERGPCLGDNTFLLMHISHTTPTLSAFPQRSGAAAAPSEPKHLGEVEKGQEN